MNKISPRPLFFFLACIAPVGKIISLPARLAAYAGNDLLLPAALQFICQAALIFCVLLLAKRGKTFYELLESAFGRITAKVLVLLYSAFLFFAALVPILEQQLFVQGTFYDTIPSVVAFSPFFVLLAYLCSKPIEKFGRTWDVLGPLALAGLFGILILSVSNADYAALLPVGSSGAKGILGGAAYTSGWFFDSALLLPLLGKIEYRRGTAWKGALFYLAGGALTLFFYATYYGIFEGLAIHQLFAFTETSKYFSGITVLGRIDYVFIYSLALVMVFYVALPLQGGVEGVLQAFGRKKYLPTLLSVGVSLLFFVFAVLFDLRFGEVMNAVTRTVCWIFPLFTVLFPVLCLFFGREHESA